MNKVIERKSGNEAYFYCIGQSVICKYFANKAVEKA